MLPVRTAVLEHFGGENNILVHLNSIRTLFNELFPKWLQKNEELRFILQRKGSEQGNPSRLQADELRPNLTAPP